MIMLIRIEECRYPKHEITSITSEIDFIGLKSDTEIHKSHYMYFIFCYTVISRIRISHWFVQLYSKTYKWRLSRSITLLYELWNLRSDYETMDQWTFMSIKSAWTRMNINSENIMLKLNWQYLHWHYANGFYEYKWSDLY